MDKQIGKKPHKMKLMTAHTLSQRRENTLQILQEVQESSHDRERGGRKGPEQCLLFSLFYASASVTSPPSLDKMCEVLRNVFCVGD